MRRFALAAALLAGCTPTASPEPVRVDRGIASWYGEPQRLACGGRLSHSAMTVAHRSLPCGTRLRIVARHSGRSVDAVVADRGPYVRGRVVDLAPAPAREIGLIGPGLFAVDVFRLP